MAQWGRAQLNFISLRSPEQKSEINKRDAYGRLMDPQRERETKRELKAKFPYICLMKEEILEWQKGL